MGSIMSVITLANRCNNHILHIIVNRKVDGWLLHHLDLFIGYVVVVIANHLLDVGLMALTDICGPVVARVIMRVTLWLPRCLLLAGALGLL
jgi:hypothetical protein